MRASAAPRLRPARLNRAATRKEYSEMKTKIEKQPHLARFCHELRCTPSHPVALRRTPPPPRTPPQCTCGGGFKNSNLYNGIRGFVLKRKASNPSLAENKPQPAERHSYGSSSKCHNLIRPRAAAARRRKNASSNQHDNPSPMIKRYDPQRNLRCLRPFRE